MRKKKKCPYCDDMGRRTCIECQGKGYNKTVDPASYSLYGKATYKTINCIVCNGKGKIPCIFCMGIGWI